MYKLVAIDLDGTMLNQYGIITEKTKKAISKAQEKGVEVMIASGRAITSVKRFSKEINSNKYFISGNGAITYDIKNNKILYENILSKTKALQIIKICEENSIYYNVYTENGIIAKNLSWCRPSCACCLRWGSPCSPSSWPLCGLPWPCTAAA